MKKLIFQGKIQTFTKNTEMYSDGEIKVVNLNGEFHINGSNSNLKK